MHAYDIRQCLIRQNVFCTISPNITLANISSYTVITFVHESVCVCVRPRGYK